MCWRGLFVVVLVVVLVGVAWGGPTQARAVRRLFEPTDLELEGQGRAELDLQAGLVRGPDAFRFAVPDLELDVGLLRNLELDLDGALAVEGPDDGGFAFGGDEAHLVYDNVWLAFKCGVLAATAAEGTKFALGLQAGPKLPVARGASGVGVEALVLAGVHVGHTHLIVNAGGLVDPAASDAGRPYGVEGGLDLDQELGDSGHWDLTGEIGGIAFASDDGHQLNVTVGVSWSPSEWLDLSLVGLGGLLPGSDRFGLLIGVAPKLALWR